MPPRDQALRSLLSLTEFEALEVLAGWPTSITGRELARRLGVAPTTASTALAKLGQAGFATSEEHGRAYRWRLNRHDPTIAGWLLESGSAHPAASHERPQMTVLLLTALSLEYAAISEYLDFENSAYVQSVRFERATFEGEFVTWDVYAAEVGMGNEITGVVTTAASERFGPDLALFVGVAGSLKPSDLCRGDVFLPDRVYDLGAGKEIRTKDGPELLLRPFSTEAAMPITQFARSVARGDWMAKQRQLRPDIEANNEQGKAPRVVVKSLAAGNRVLNDNESPLVGSLKKNFNDVAAVDMESLGFYQAARFAKLPALSIRGISDHVVDKTVEADEKWQPIAAAHAASFAFTLLHKARAEDVLSEVPPPGAEPPDGGASRRPGRPKRPRGGPAGIVVDREILYRLPPAVAIARSWAARTGAPGADGVVQELYECRNEPGEWLQSLRPSSRVLSGLATSTSTLFMVAVFAESYGHPSASWLLEEAAKRAPDQDTAALLLGRAAWSARQRHQVEYSDNLLARARKTQALAEPLWRLYDAVFTSMTLSLLDDVSSVASGLGLRLALPGAPTGGANRDFMELVERWHDDCPELLDMLRFQIAILAAAQLRQHEDYAGALQVYEAMKDTSAIVDPGVVWASLMGPRGSLLPLETARTICSRVAARTPELRLDRDQELARAVELAMTSRDRRLDWNGPTSDPLAVAAEAKVRAGDPRGALRLLLAPPDGTALPSEAISPQIVDLAPRIAFMTGDMQLTMALAARLADPVERRITMALALGTRQDSQFEATRELRAVLEEPSVAERVDQRVRALLGLAGIAGLTSEDEKYFEGLDAETLDLIRAQSMIRGGQASEAQALMRPHSGTAAELQIAVEVLVSQGLPEEAIERLERYATRFGEEHLLLQAASLAISAGLLDRAEVLASRVSASQDAIRRRTSLEMQIDIAQQRADWQRVVSETGRLLSDPALQVDEAEVASAKARYRWARVNALYQERDTAAAYVELEADPPLEASNKSEAMLITAVLRAIAHEIGQGGTRPSVYGRAFTQRDVLRRATTIAKRFQDEEEVVAAALMTSLSMPADEEVAPEELFEARQLQDLFFARFPESKLVQRISVPASPEELAAMVAGQLAAAAGPLEQMRQAVFTGRHPLSAYAAAAQRSYAEGLVQNAAGAYVLESGSLEIITEERAVAHAALRSDVVIDTSALFHSTRVLGHETRLHDNFARLILPASLRDDILSARASLARRSVGAFGWDPVLQRPRLTVYDEAMTDRWAKDAQRLADQLRLCDVLPDAPFDADPRNLTWSAAIRLAKQREVSLIADDVALRHVARLEGVRAFGTLHLLAALIDKGDLPSTAQEDAFARLIQVRAAELPVLDQLHTIAEREGWRPSGYAGFLFMRPLTWSPPSKGLALYMKLVHEMPPREIDTIADWCGVAAYGMALSVPPSLVVVSIGSLVAWTTLDWKGPEALPLLLERTRRTISEFAPGTDLLKDVVQRIVNTLRHVVPAELVGQVALRLFEKLDENDRLKAVEYVLSAP